MKSLLPRMLRDRRRGLALIIVITTISLISILVVAIFSITRTEFKATQGFVFARSAKQLGDIGTAIVQAQITNAHNTSTVANQRTIHATQPGMVRVYNAIGNFTRAHKLYSSSQMTVTGNNEAVLFSSDHQIPQDWNSDANKARYVDLNDPVIRPSRQPGAYALYFPIIDPRAAAPATDADDPAPVEGFSYSKQTAQAGTGGIVNYQEVITPADVAGDKNKLRLPMPVEWLYVLQDGTTGTLDEQNSFVSSMTGAVLDPEEMRENPIIGRVAFWTDDESCKVNVNTAAEPTFFSPPYFYHQRDHNWASFPPASGEYQRYPGHPATVALSAILAPGITLDPYKPGVNRNAIVETKEQMYELAPKIAKGGSKSGTLPFVRDDFSAARGEESDTANVSDAAMSRSERLFASVDDLIFKEGPYDNNLRPAALYNLPASGGRRLFDREAIERSRFFLTAHSRAPEMTIHGLPRITMWPVADERLGPNYRTSFDNMLALCSTLQPSGGAGVDNSYIFRRSKARDPLFDVTGSSATYGSSDSLRRNSDLLNYLYRQMTTLNFPATSSAGTPGSNFGTKYGTLNAAQLAVQFFDYIRCTNLYDGVLARENDGRDGANLNGTALYELRDQKEGTYRTYTNHRVTAPASGSLRGGGSYRLGNQLLSDDSKVFPGHGQVTPARWPGPSGVSAPGDAKGFQGFGRMFTLSEIGFQIICTADGKNDDLYPVNCGGVLSGGGCAPKGLSRRAGTEGTPGQPLDADTTLPPQWPAGVNRLGFQRWYSNFPPLDESGLPPGEQGKFYGCDPKDPNRHPSRHPGYDPANWNMTLDTATAAGTDGLPITALKAREKRVQVMLMLEGFCPTAGWTKIHPEWAIVLDSAFMRSIKLEGQTLFPTATDVIIKSNENIYEDFDVYSLGGHVGPTAIAGGRSVPGWGGQMGNDTDPYVSGANRGSSGSRYMTDTPGHTGLNNWGLVSQFVTVFRDNPNGLRLSFGQRDLVIKIYDSHEKAGINGAEIQTVRLSLDDIVVPAPALAYGGERRLANDPSGTNPASKQPANRGEISNCWWVDAYGRDRYRRALPAPHWWCFNRMGCIGRMTGQVNPGFTGQEGQALWAVPPAFDNDFSGSDDQLLHGRLDTEARFATGVNGAGGATWDDTPRDGVGIIPPEVTSGYVDESGGAWTGSDVIRTFVPAVGDYRLAAARNDVPRNMWRRHPVWERVSSQPVNTQPRTIHSFTTHWATTESGVVLPTNGIVNNPKFSGIVTKNQVLVEGAPYSDARIPDLPPHDDWRAAANSFGDFDNGIANTRDGAYINKPDEGNFYAGNFTRHSTTKFYRSGYFFEPWRNSDDWRSGVYMTPNRIVTSPVMFGSLPTGVWSGGNVPTTAAAASTALSPEGRPWQTLLFRPYSRSHQSLAKANHPGNYNPRDHYLLDLFTMPVVEPYAISEPLSTAGKINLNYQIMPFTNIRRASALHALMKGEFITAIPRNTDVNNAKGFRQNATAGDWGGGKGDLYYDEFTAGQRKFWHRPINVNATLGQFDQKFNLAASATIHSASYRGLFRSPTQICEMHLIPDVSAGISDGGENVGTVGSINASSTGAQVESAMSTFWVNHSPTGDNTRERPYSNLYARVTTRSNTFRVHIRAQVIRKARSVPANQFDPSKDTIVSEYRGSSLIERFIDPTNTTASLPDYGESNNPASETPLEAFYQFRTLESKRFSP
jgi:uncharacterized protein (TIGR02600 family)